MVRDRPRAWRECIRLPQRVERIAVTPAQEREIEQLAQRAARARETGIGHLFVDDVVDDAMRQRRDAGGPTPKVDGHRRAPHRLRAQDGREPGEQDAGMQLDADAGVDMAMHRQMVMARSEEHTSELQSLMRNSYAVFCLKKK